MLNWLFKRRGAAGLPPSANPLARTGQRAGSGPSISAGTPKPKAVEDTGAAWPEQLRVAQGDDAALLRIATLAPRLDIKLAAVEAIVSETSLRQAEREFRSHDRKVHQVAKQRLNAAVAGREARAKAQTLLDRTGALVDEEFVPINLVVELDRNWEGLPVQLLEPGQAARFADLRARLDIAMREHDEKRRQLQGWAADARRFLLDWPKAIASAADHGTTQELALLGQTVGSLREARPDVPATSDLDLALARALQSVAPVQARLAWFEAQIPHNAPDDVPGESPVATPAQHWGALAALNDDELAGVLNRRHERWLTAMQPSRPAKVSAPAAVDPTRSDAVVAEQRLGFETLLQQAEVVLAEGRLGEVQQHLQAIDVALSAMKTMALPDVLRARHQALRAESARLKGWQQWGGALARDDLTAQAEKLAASTLAAPAPDGPDGPDGPDVPHVPYLPTGPKLDLRALAEDIRTLRTRWKELDRLGAVASPDLWHRFDAALKTSSEPVAAQHAAHRAARQDNLAARQALLDQIEALPVPQPSAPEDAGMVDCRELQRELSRFQLAWRKLGPVEHTVPNEAREALQQRLRQSLERIEAPLREVLAATVAAREGLVVRAEALASEADRHLDRHQTVSDAPRQVRDLQAAWRDLARQMPLPRAQENALWTRFKAATDAVFAHREAALAAREVELAANLAARETLLERLSGLNSDTPNAEVKRTLADVDREWRQTTELPRGAGEVIEGRWRSARAAASQLLVDLAHQHWGAQCDALVAKLALCDERESVDAGIDLDVRWAAAKALPADWEQALALRWARSGQRGPLPEAEVDDLLLRLEMALDLPAAPEWQEARRNLKLRALKDAMEGRTSPLQRPAQRSDGLLAILRQSGLNAVQRGRLHAVVAALRQSPPQTDHTGAA